MCGSGTTLVAAARLGRHFIGGDASALAIETTSRRLDDASIAYRLLEGLPQAPAANAEATR